MSHSWKDWKRGEEKSKLFEREVISATIYVSFLFFSGSGFRALSDSPNFSYPFIKFVAYTNSHSLTCPFAKMSLATKEKLLRFYLELLSLSMNRLFYYYDCNYF